MNKITKKELRKYLNRYSKGKITKIQAERELFGTDVARGKRIARVWASTLGVDTRAGKVTPLA
jgi:hypothetical protein